MICLGAKEFNWPKDLSGGPEVTKLTGGLDKAKPVAPVSSKSKGILIKPNPLQVRFDALCMWVIGESLKGRTSGVSKSPMIVALPESKLCASALIIDPLHVTSEVTPSVRIEGDHLGEAASATEASKFGFIGKVVTNWGMGDEN